MEVRGNALYRWAKNFKVVLCVTEIGAAHKRVKVRWPAGNQSWIAATDLTEF